MSDFQQWKSVPRIAKPVCGNVRLAVYGQSHEDKAALKAHSRIYWDRMQDKERRAVIFAENDLTSREVFLNSIEQSPLSFMCFYKKWQIGLAWFEPVHEMSQTASFHAALNPRAPLEALLTFGRAFLKESFLEYKCLCCFLPAKYTGLLAILDQLGFERKARLPGSCWFHYWQRMVDGIFAMKLREPENRA